MYVLRTTVFWAIAFASLSSQAENTCHPAFYLSTNMKQSPGKQLAYLVTATRKVGAGLPPLEFLAGAPTAACPQGAPVPVLAIQNGGKEGSSRQTLMANAVNADDLLDVASDFRLRADRLTDVLEKPCRDRLERFNLLQSPARGYGVVEYGLTMCLNAEIVLRRQSGRREESDGTWDLDDLLDGSEAVESCLKLLCTAR